jgi:hypothetical protein
MNVIVYLIPILDDLVESKSQQKNNLHVGVIMVVVYRILIHIYGELITFERILRLLRLLLPRIEYFMPASAHVTILFRYDRLRKSNCQKSIIGVLLIIQQMPIFVNCLRLSVLFVENVLAEEISLKMRISILVNNIPIFLR